MSSSHLIRTADGACWSVELNAQAEPVRATLTLPPDAVRGTEITLAELGRLRERRRVLGQERAILQANRRRGAA